MNGMWAIQFDFVYSIELYLRQIDNIGTGFPMFLLSSTETKFHLRILTT